MYNMEEKVVAIKNLKVYFELKNGFIKDIFSKEKSIVKAVDGISLDIKKGEIVSLVGESGSGKTTTGKAILNLIEKTDGEILFKGQKINSNNKKEIKAFRQKAQIIFQDPYQSLNPRNIVMDIIAEPLEVNGLVKNSVARKEKVINVLELSGLSPGEDFLYRFPHELSGGQRQRVAIAGSIILEPDFIVADEPISMLDASIRIGVLNTLMELRDKKRISYLFITHDLSLAWLISDRIAIMYLGKIMEIGDSDTIINKSMHPYTKALISAIPLLEVSRNREKIILQGEIPSPTKIPEGCRFHPRCKFAENRCRTKEPELKAVNKDHFVACHLLNI